MVCEMSNSLNSSAELPASRTISQNALDTSMVYQIHKAGATSGGEEVAPSSGRRGVSVVALYLIIAIF
jgi:hypothetical protein